jgi:hypothetical protein
MTSCCYTLKSNRLTATDAIARVCLARDNRDRLVHPVVVSYLHARNL